MDEFGFQWFLLPLIGGYRFIRKYRRYEYRTLAESGYHTFFQAAFFGVLLFGVSLLFTGSISWLFPCISQFWYKHVSSIRFSGTSLLAFVLGFLLPYPLNRKTREKHLAWTLDSFRKMNRSLELMLTQAFLDGKMVAVTLVNDKVYIGFPLEPLEIEANREYISLGLTYSGHRNEKRQLIIDYDVAEDVDAHVEIPLDKVVSVSYFDLGFYLKVSPPEAEIPPTAEA